ncbi:MAG: hypothetical protein IPP15_21135 [Saprospiraceae bacterium]|uniref:Uncharacterized protein n=1 Tax=Candidatus Opimibacter skivensis TaxID=2982028 RepID=A0A9D7XPS5_9BACT|nr:hypothetical protein [Candidatus Opimibacter skivensis]
MTEVFNGKIPFTYFNQILYFTNPILGYGYSWSNLGLWRTEDGGLVWQLILFRHKLLSGITFSLIPKQDGPVMIMELFNIQTDGMESFVKRIVKGQV